MNGRPQPESRTVVRARDDGLRHLARLRRWLVVGSVALTGAVAALVAQAKPGKSSSASAAPAASPRTSQSATAAPQKLSASGAQTPISPPAQAPAPAPAAPSAPVVSGGS